MLKIWGRRNSINVQKAMRAAGEFGIAHAHIALFVAASSPLAVLFQSMKPRWRTD